MVPTDAKSETPRAWRDKEIGGNSDDSDSYSGIGLPGRAVGYQSVRISGADRKKENFLEWARGDSSGKILAQLIEETQQELAHHAEQVEKLTERLQALELLDHQLTQKTEE